MSAASPIRQFAKSSRTMALLYFGATGLSFSTGVVLARLLGASGYGVYALAMTTATLAGMVTEFGLPVLAMRETGTARATDKWAMLKGLLHWSDRAILMLSALLVAGTWAGYELFARDRSSAYLATLLWAVALVPFVAIGKLRSSVMLALDQMFASQFPVMILRPLLFLLGCLGLWWMAKTLDPQQAMQAQVGAAAIVMAMIILLYMARRPVPLAQARPEFKPKAWLAACLPMGMSEGLRLLQGQLAVLLVGWFATTAQAGIYRVADAVVQVTAIFASVAGTVATPMFSRLWGEGDTKELERVAILSAWIMVGGALILGLPIALFGHWIFPLIFGAEFSQSVPVFWILSGGMVLWSTLGLVSAVANMTGHHNLVTRSLALIALLNIAFSAFLIPYAGAIGAAIASMTAAFLGTLYCSIAFKSRTGIATSIFARDSIKAGIAGIELAKQTLMRRIGGN